MVLQISADIELFSYVYIFKYQFRCYENDNCKWFFFVSVMIDGFDYGCCQRWGDVILSCQKQNFKELGVVETRNDRYAINQNWKKLLVDGNRMKTYLHMSKYYYSLSDR